MKTVTLDRGRFYVGIGAAGDNYEIYVFKDRATIAKSKTLTEQAMLDLSENVPSIPKSLRLLSPHYDSRRIDRQGRFLIRRDLLAKMGINPNSEVLVESKVDFFRVRVK